MPRRLSPGQQARLTNLRQPARCPLCAPKTEVSGLARHIRFTLRIRHRQLPRHVRLVPCADIFFEANLVISRAARFKRTTKILRRELVHER
jgi:hypothetical protein